MLKGRFYQVLLPKWQRKLGAPKPDESFEDLFARARALERHEEYFSAGCRDNARGKSTTDEEVSTRGDGTAEQRTSISSKGAQHRKGSRQEVKGGKGGHPHFLPDERKKSETCYHCGELGHHRRDCPKL